MPEDDAAGFGAQTAKTTGTPTANTSQFAQHMADAGDTGVDRPDEVKSGEDFSALPLSHLVGAPLLAAVQAIQQCTLVTIEFIKHHCFTKESSGAGGGEGSDTWGTPRYLSFEYTKTTLIGMQAPSVFKVPLLVMVPIPTLRLEYVEVHFLAKVDTIETYKASQTGANVDTQIDATTKTENTVNADGTEEMNTTRLGPVNAMRVNQTKTSGGSTVTKNFSYDIKVRAVDDESSPGMDKLLEILDSLVQETAGDEVGLDALIDTSAMMPDAEPM